MREGWRTVKLGNLCSIEKKKYDGQHLPYVGLEDIESNTGRFLGATQPLSVKSATFQFSSEHVLYGRLRPYLNKVLLPDFEGHCSSEIFPIKPGREITRNFLFYWLTSQPIVDKINATSTGARMPRANVNTVLKFDFSFPCLDEQQRITTILDEAFSGIDTAINNTEKNLVNAKELFTGSSSNFFKKITSKTDYKKIKDICINLDNRRVPITKSKRKSGKIPYYGASGIVDHVESYIFDEDILLVSEDGANLLTRTYPIAFSVSEKCWVNNHAHVLKFDNIYSQKFIEYYLNTISLEPYITGAAQPKLNQKALSFIEVPFPDLVTQQQTVEQLKEISSAIKELTTNYQQKLTVLTELKQSLLQKAFNGELTAT